MWALFTLDLNRVTDAQRATFYEALREYGWVKLPHLTTAWQGRMNNVTRNQALMTVRQHIQQAAAQSRVRSYNCAVSISGEEPTRIEF